MNTPHHSFEIPDALIFQSGQGGLEQAILTHKSGTRCEVYLYGAHVTRWQSRMGRELLFISKKAEFVQGKGIRGGIPIIFPQFSGQGPLPSHGFARTSVWHVEDTKLSPRGDVSITLSLSSNDDTRKIWEHEFLSTLTITLNERLTILHEVKNTGEDSFDFQNAFHTYFRMSDASTTSIVGLRGVQYIDFLKNRSLELEARERVSIEAATDRAYMNTPDTVQILDETEKAAFTLRKKGMKDAVLWNPWKDKITGFKDMMSTDYLTMVCLEAGNVENKVSLAPQEEWESMMELSYQHG